MFLGVTPEYGLVCYVTSVTSVQHNADCKFFNCQLKYGEKQYVNGVVFSPEKRHIIKKYSDEKSPVKINNYSIGNRYVSSGLVMHNKTFFKDASKPNFEPDQGKENENVSLGNLNNIAAEQLVTVKAKIINLSGVKVLPRANETLRKREMDISDPTGTSKLLLWEESCEQSLESGVTYIFLNFRLKARGELRYLNSHKMGGSSPTNAYQEEVQESFSPNMFYQEDAAELVEIKSISKYNSCLKCRQKMQCSDTQKILQCICGVTMKRKILSSI